ncbi:hypothetical protein [Ferrithrix thermotolerans]|uniref:hypothetical protein n=1 Tax=Ferrithrix thermotolerans TaxID=209649 RepID=UPI0015BAFB94|nr:hypothetical protein [Ferrithrix thermotolerans]
MSDAWAVVAATLAQLSQQPHIYPGRWASRGWLGHYKWAAVVLILFKGSLTPKRA